MLRGAVVAVVSRLGEVADERVVVGGPSVEGGTLDESGGGGGGGPSPPTGKTPVANSTITAATTRAAATAPPMSHGARLRRTGWGPDWERDGVHGGGAETGRGPLPKLPWLPAEVGPAKRWIGPEPMVGPAGGVGRGPVGAAGGVGAGRLVGGGGRYGCVGGAAGGPVGWVDSSLRSRILAACRLSVAVSASSAAFARSPAVAYRSSGFLAMPRAITWSKATGMPGRIWLGRGIAAVRCAVISALRLSAR